MKATGLPGVWAVSMYETAQSAAAAVAFFNGAIDDQTVIGIDREGVDWGTVGRWAQLRTANGSADPAAIQLWEVGNEVYGGVPAYGGADCEEFGWEEVWTCNGTEYVEGDATHDGYRDIRAAMLAVDPTIEVGAVGLGEPSAWSNWGSDVIAAAGDELDFYSVHHYGYDTSPDPQEALFKPAQEWRDHFGALREALPAGVPIAVTEFNLVSSEGGDVNDVMASAANGLYIAETIGQLVAGGVTIANHWVLAHGDDNGDDISSGTAYGLFDSVTYIPSAQYDAMAIWGTVGDTLLDVQLAPSLDMPALRVYPTRRDDGSLVMLMLNLGPVADTITVRLDGMDRDAPLSATVSTVRAVALTDHELLRDAPVGIADFDESGQPVEIPAWSMTRIEAPGM